MSYLDNYIERLDIRGTSSGKNVEDGITNTIKRDWDKSPSARTVIITNTAEELRRVRIQTAKKTVGIDKIYIHPDDSLHSGDIIHNLQDFSWLVLDTKLIGHIYKQANIVRINRVLKWLYKGQILEQPIRVKNFSRVDGVDDYYFFTMPENTLNIFMPFTEKTATIKRDERFMIDKIPYRVTRVDDFTYTGVTVLFIVEDIRNASDTDDVADYIEPIPPITDIGYIEGKSEIPYGLEETYTMSIANTTVPATWTTDIAASWFTLQQDTYGATIKVKRGTEHIGKSITLQANYNGEIYTKLIFVKSLV